MNLKKITQSITDTVLINICYVLAFYIRFWGNFPAENFGPYIKLWPLISIIAFLIFNVYGLYDTIRKTWEETFFSLICSIALIAMFGMSLVYFTGGFAFPRSVFLISCVLHFLILGLYRYYAWKVEKIKHGVSEIIIIASISEIKDLAEKAENDSLGIHHVIGYITNDSNDICDYDGIKLGTFSQVEKILSEHQPKEVMLGTSVPHETKVKVLSFCLENAVIFNLLPDIYDIMLSEVKLVQINDKLLFRFQQLEMPLGQQVIKRIFDISISSILLVIVFPLGLIVSALIKIDSSGPVFYRQERISQYGKSFKLIKFRTMIDKAEEMCGPVIAEKNDSRITRVGKFLRATRIDELPQLINVLFGDMSLVGPRPERPYFVEQYINTIPGYEYRQKIKSGLTGWAQVAGNYSTTPQDKLSYDLLYAKKRSILFDIKILLQTIKVVLMKNKAS